MGINLMGAGVWGKKFQEISLPTGGLYAIPSGQYIVQPGQYTFVQYYDAGANIWRNLNQPVAGGGAMVVTSDGYNVRLANLTGCVVGAIVTNGGTGYTNGIYPAGTGLGTAASPTATVAAGGGTIVPTLNVIVGGVINTTVTITTPGSNYTRAPVLTFSAPPAGGIPATAICTISGGAINAVTVTNAGAGYTTAPTITVTNAQGDTTGSGGVLTVNSTLAQSGAISALTIANPGAGLTSVPAISFSPASTSAATAIMCWTATTVTFASPSNAGNGNFALINSTVVAGSSTTTNPAITTGLFVPRLGYTAMSTTATPTTTTIVDGGLHQVVPNAVLAYNSNGTISAAGTTTIAQGGVNDTSLLLPL
jgi:hypothetical protein